MQKVRIFKGLESELRTLEDQVNEFLASDNVRIVNVFGNIAPQTSPSGDTPRLGRTTYGASDVMLVVVYEQA